MNSRGKSHRLFRLQGRQKQLSKVFVHKEDDGADDDEAGLAGQPQVESIAVQQAGTQNKMQSQLTSVELFTANAGLTISVYEDGSEEATAVQAMYLSQINPDSNKPCAFASDNRSIHYPVGCAH